MPVVAVDPAVSQYAAQFETIEALQAEAAELLQRLQAVYAQIGETATNGARRQGTYRRYTGRTTARTHAKGARAPRGALKAALRNLLANGKPVRVSEIVKQLPKAGYKTASKPRVFYTNVYLTLKRDKAFKKTPDGFKLKK
jgi:hypothetical protein